MITTHSVPGTPANFTRHSESFVAKFIREGRLHFIPLYWLLRLSDFGREGMDHSGSYLFADHMYRGIPSGRGRLGRWLDALLLKLPATRSMRQRCFEARDAMRRSFDLHVASGDAGPFRILTVPCGLPRDVRDFAAELATQNPSALARLEYRGMDLDPKVLAAAQVFLEGSAIREPELTIGNALQPHDYPAEAPHFISSTGLGEFLDDAALHAFYRNVFDNLAPGGTFFTSAAARGKGSDVLLRAFEFEIHYRTRAEVGAVLGSVPWQSVEFTQGAIGLQTFVRAIKSSRP